MGEDKLAERGGIGHRSLPRVDNADDQNRPRCCLLHLPMVLCGHDVIVRCHQNNGTIFNALIHGRFHHHVCVVAVVVVMDDERSSSHTEVGLRRRNVGCREDDGSSSSRSDQAEEERRCVSNHGLQGANELLLVLPRLLL
jgi:hypothetical protein